MESMLSSQTNLSHSMFTVKWVQVGDIHTAIQFQSETIKKNKKNLLSKALTWVTGHNKHNKMLSKQNQVIQRSDNGMDIQFTLSVIKGIWMLM